MTKQNGQKNSLDEKLFKCGFDINSKSIKPIVKKNLSSINTYQLRKVMYILLIFLLITVIKANSQGGLTDPGQDPDNAPIDGGLSLLIAGGVGYAVKKIKRKNIKNLQNHL